MYKREKSVKKILNRQDMELQKILIVVLVLLGIIAAVIHSAYVNMGEIKKQLQQNLEDVGNQNAVIVHSKIHAQYELLNSLSKELQGVTTDTIDEKLDSFKIFLEDFGLKRFAFSFPDGMTYSTDGEEATDLSYRDFYKRGMAGKCDITGVLTDALKIEHDKVNVMTIPIFDEKENVSGVFGVAYDTEIFNESLQIDSFEGQGYSCIIDEDGKIVATIGTDNLEISHNIFEDIQKADKRNEQVVENLQSQIENKKTGNGTLYLSGKNYYYSVPISLMDGCVTWYILTIVPTELLNERVTPIQMNQYATSFFVGILVVLGAVLIIRYLKKQHEQMVRFAYEDSLTKGPNFVKFCLDMEHRKNSPGWMIVMDITNFNNITIVAGEEAGNTMLKETWKIIEHSLCKDEMAGRVRDDMFVMFLSVSEEELLIQRMEEISRRISEKSKDFQVYGVKAGYGIYQMSGEETIENAYSKAKIAKEYMLTKQEWHYAFYNEVNRVKTQHEKQLEERFPMAIEKKEFEVYYQPKYSAADCAVVGSEALVRWRNEDGSMVSPGEFIPLFERNGMIIRLDEYMFRAVCMQQKKWLMERKTVYPVSVNISRTSLYCADVEQRYREIMQECEIDPKYIQIEVTETVMEEKEDIGELLNKFRQMGVKILMDDFGTGYSSLATLSNQYFDTLKLDKTLIDHIGNKDGEILLYHVIQMGQQMGLHITAEGVEKQTQLQFLQDLKCDDIQGFYFSKPLPVDEYENMLNQLGTT